MSTLSNDEKIIINQNAPVLSDQELSSALNKLNITSHIERFPEVERRYTDPPVELQKIGLISFIPARGAKPNDKGIFGFAKLRGNYNTENEANERAEYLIRNVDSYHHIYHAYVGRPFPLTTSSDFSREVTKIDLQRETSVAVAQEVKRLREKEQKEMKEIEDREKELLDDVKKQEENLDDHYTTLRVKKAQLVWTYVDTKNKLQQMLRLIAKARKEIEDLEAKDSNLRNIYYDKYMEARKKAGLSTDKVENSDNFIKYMVEDISLPEVDEEYNKLYA
jgi:flagellar motility protein MotE (MotC chaperone)